jgi:hypothetical protein
LAVLIWLSFGVIALFIGVLGSRHGFALW